MNNTVAEQPRAASGWLRTLVASQVWLSRQFDRLLPGRFQDDGNMYFRHAFAPTFLFQGALVYDVGSGRHPFLTSERKQELAAHVVGLDIDAREIAAAPPGCYDEAVVSDVTLYHGLADADLVICQSLMEHVQGVPLAFAAMASMLRLGGMALLFAPSRNALFARLNLLLPQALKQRILFGIFPETRDGCGFVSHYERCTPRDFCDLAQAAGLEVVALRCFYKSGYFSFFLPLHVLYRLWNVVHGTFRPMQGAETFCVALRKPAP